MSHRAEDLTAGAAGGCLPASHLQRLPCMFQEGRIRDVQGLLNATVGALIPGSFPSGGGGYSASAKGIVLK